MRKIIAMILTIAMALAQLPLTAIAVAPSVGAYSVGDAGGYLAASLRTSRNLYIERKFNYVAGKGFAAERANNLYDFLHGYKAEVIGDSNAANGADRKIISGYPFESAIGVATRAMARRSNKLAPNLRRQKR